MHGDQSDTVSPTESTDCAVVVDPDAIAGGEDALGIGAGDAPPGTYALVFELDTAATLSVGALGTATFPAGAYAYVGSAFGSNGLGRVDRHRRVATGDHDVTHWHVDYLGSHPDVSLDSVVAAPGADAECRLARELLPMADDDRRSPDGTPTPSRGSDGCQELTSSPIEGFGASDCDCRTHLVSGPDAETLRSAVLEALRTVL
jgi:Uri superfamily endonuclease